MTPAQRYPWEPRGDLLHCKKHNFSFGKTEQCPSCEPPAILDDSAVDTTPPTGCLTVDEHERWYTEQSERWAAHAWLVLDGSVEIAEKADQTTVAAKAADLARKFRVNAVDLTHNRDRQNLIKQLRKERERVRKGWGN